MDILSKLIITVWGMFKVKDMLRVNMMSLKEVTPEIVDNINIGSRLILNSTASMLIMGTIRFLVQQYQTIETFGKLSFTLSLSNMFLTFINTAGIVMFPLSRRTNKERLLSSFVTLRGVFIPLTCATLPLYTPVKFVLGIWLPRYSEGLKFMGILFPIVTYGGRMSLLINTYLKTLRKGKTTLFVNVLALALSLILSLFAILVVGSLNLAVGLISVSLAFRCNLAEIFLCKDMNTKIGNSTVLETLITLLFIFSNLWFGGSIYSFISYAIVYIIYFSFIHKSLVNNAKNLKYLVKG